MAFLISYDKVRPTPPIAGVDAIPPLLNFKNEWKFSMRNKQNDSTLCGCRLMWAHLKFKCIQKSPNACRAEVLSEPWWGGGRWETVWITAIHILNVEWVERAMPLHATVCLEFSPCNEPYQSTSCFISYQCRSWAWQRFIFKYEFPHVFVF